MATITVDRATRDILRGEILMDLSGQYDSVALDNAMRKGDGEELRRRHELAAQDIALLDALGWAEDDERTAYELPADSATVDWLTRTRRAVDSSLDDVRRELATLGTLDRVLDEMAGAVA
jgi:hypothetical protein